MTGRFERAWPTVRAVLGGIAGASVLTLLRVPAGGIVGAVVGSAAVSSRGQPVTMPPWTRVVGLILLGSAAGLPLDTHTLLALARLAVPLLVALALMMALDVVLALLLAKRYNVDMVTGLHACAPGAVTEIMVVAQQAGARIGIVLAIHVVRVLTVVVLVLPLLVGLLRT